jgi:hypothetical protein
LASLAKVENHDASKMCMTWRAKAQCFMIAYKGTRGLCMSSSFKVTAPNLFLSCEQAMQPFPTPTSWKMFFFNKAKHSPEATPACGSTPAEGSELPDDAAEEGADSSLRVQYRGSNNSNA